jgi:hypothetical protein
MQITRPLPPLARPSTATPLGALGALDVYTRTSAGAVTRRVQLTGAVLAQGVPFASLADAIDAASMVSSRGGYGAVAVQRDARNGFALVQLLAPTPVFLDIDPLAAGGPPRRHEGFSFAAMGADVVAIVDGARILDVAGGRLSFADITRDAALWASGPPQLTQVSTGEGVPIGGMRPGTIAAGYRIEQAGRSSWPIEQARTIADRRSLLVDRARNGRDAQPTAHVLREAADEPGRFEVWEGFWFGVRSHGEPISWGAMPGQQLAQLVRGAGVISDPTFVELRAGAEWQRLRADPPRSRNLA